jgi:hypothetical protein
MSTTNKGVLVTQAWAALTEFGKITAQEFADYADIGRYDAHAVLSRMSKRTKAGEKRLHICDWVHAHDDARRYPRPVFMLGDFPDKSKPKPNLRENRRRSEHKRYNMIRATSIFNIAMTRDKIREIRKTL